MFAIATLLWSLLLPAELRAQPAIDVSLNDQAKFVLTAENHSTFGIEFLSPSGSLITALDDEGNPAPTPFPLLLSNQPHRVTYGTLPPAITLDGEVTLQAGWNPNGQRDVSYHYSDGLEVAGPFDLAADRYRGSCADCPSSHYPQMWAELDKQNQLTLAGAGHQLSSLRLESPSGSLRSAGTAAPFSNLTENTPQAVEFHADTPVTIAGTLTLPVGWNAQIAGRDLTYQYELGGGQTGETGPFSISEIMYPPKPRWPPVRIDFDADQQFVLTGNGQSLSQFRLHSASGSLRHLGGAGPFDSVSGDTQELAFAAPSTAVVVDGRLTLPVRWPIGEQGTRKDIQYTYQFTGDDKLHGPRTVPSNAYPREPTYPPLWVSVNDDFRIEVRGHGQPLNRLSLHSAAGSLLPGTQAAPFASLGESTSQRIDYHAGSDTLMLEGTVVLDAGWDVEGKRDGQVSYDLAGVSSTVQDGFAAYPVEPSYDNIRVYIDDDYRVQLRGNGQPLYSLEVQSESGSLIPGESSGPFAAMTVNTAHRVEYLAGNSPVILDGYVALDTEWDINGERDVQVTYDLVGVADDVQLQVNGYPPEPKYVYLKVSVNDQAHHLQIRGQRQPLKNLQIMSDSGSLVPGSGAGPFQSLSTNTAQLVEYLAGDTPLELDGIFVLDTQWDPKGERDLNIAYDVEGIDETRRHPIAGYPMPIQDRLYGWVHPEGGPITLVARREIHIEALDLFSDGGGLVPIASDQASPFAVLTSNTEHQISYANLGGTVFLEGSLTLDAEFYPTPEKHFDVRGSWQHETGTFDFRLHALTPEPSSLALGLSSGLVMLAACRRRRRCYAMLCYRLTLSGRGLTMVGTGGRKCALSSTNLQMAAISNAGSPAAFNH